MSNEEPQDWIFTFGAGQWGGFAKDIFVRIYGTREAARLEMCFRYGQEWSMQYPSEEAAGVLQYGLMEKK
jgi:hypothetical protein